MKKKTEAKNTKIKKSNITYERYNDIKNMKEEVSNKKKRNKTKKQNPIIDFLSKHRKIIFFIILLIVIIYVCYVVISLFKNPTDTFLVEQGQIYQEETAIGYILREETVLKGKNYKNGMSQIKTEGERVAKGEAIFRYYSNGEESLIKKIEELDTKIDEVMANEQNLFSSDTKVLENQITDKLNYVYNESDLSKIKEYKREINTYITKKAKIAGDLSPSGSYLKKLIDERSSYENKLNSGAEYLTSPISGVVSYRVDGLEELLKTDDFGKITKEFLESLNIKTGQIIAANDESGKIINNYHCYIATILDSEYAKKAIVGDEVELRLPSGEEIPAEISHINEQNNENVIILKIERGVEELISYRKISFQIIWWSDNGMKVPDSAIAYEQKGEVQVPYVIRVRAGYQDKILVKVLRDNGKYSIVTNYTSQELEEFEYNSDDEITSRKIKLYDEIMMNP